jgi:CheY-like chemotaxis protein
MAKSMGSDGTAPAGESRALDPERQPRATLLIVDDSVDAQELFRLHLAHAGYELMAARDGQHALELLQGARTPDLVIVDLLMPVMDGMELIEELRADARLAQLPVLVVSAVDVPVQVRLPQTRYLRKPFRSADLLAHVEALVAEPR